MNGAVLPPSGVELKYAKTFNSERALAVEVIVSYSQMNGNRWAAFSPAKIVVWGSSEGEAASLRAVCRLVPECLEEGFSLLLKEGYLEEVDTNLRPTDLLFRHLGAL